MSAVLNASVAFDDDVTDLAGSIVDKEITPSTDTPRKFIQTIGTSEEAIDLGDLGSVGIFFIKNLDPTNYVDVRVATSGSKFARLRPDTNSDGKGGFCMCSELGPDAQAPYAIANGSPCKVEITLCPQ